MTFISSIYAMLILFVPESPLCDDSWTIVRSWNRYLTLFFLKVIELLMHLYSQTQGTINIVMLYLEKKSKVTTLTMIFVSTLPF